MKDFVLSCCSTADFSEEDYMKKNIYYVPFHFYLNGKHYYDNNSGEMPPEKFFEAMKKSADTKTSQVNSEEFIDHFTPFLEDGKDILHISFSSGLSGVYNSALIAKRELSEKFPERKIYIVDSLGGCSGQGLIMDKLAELRDNFEYNIEKLYNWIESNKLKLQHWFTSTDLSFLVKGGRLSKAAGFVGGLLKICPIIHVDNLGKLVSFSKVRSKQKAIFELFDKMKQYAQNGLDYCEKCFVSHSACYKDALDLADLINATFKKMPEQVKISNIGPTLGSHCGPGTIALFFWGKER